MREKWVKHKSSVSTQPRPEDGSSSYDKVRVRDLVLPMRLGIWNEEKGLTQRVRFTVEVSVAPGAHHPGDIESVISYDFIVAAIEKVAAEGHQLLTETVAEQIASYSSATRARSKCTSSSRSSTAFLEPLLAAK